jgi:hypothetical protein
MQKSNKSDKVRDVLLIIASFKT